MNWFGHRGCLAGHQTTWVDLPCSYWSNLKLQVAFSSKQLFKISDNLLKNTSASVLPKNINTDELPDRFCQFFGEKIIKLRETLDSRQCNPPSFAAFEGSCFDHFNEVKEAEVSDLITKMPTKGCMLDPFPTSLVKEHLVPIITLIINESLNSGIVPPQFKTAHITPVIKFRARACFIHSLFSASF